MKPFIKYLLIFSGTISLFLGILGIFLPLLPTTPFLLLTAFCYSKSSERLHQKLMDSKFGTYITNYNKHKTIPLKVKIASISMIWVSILSSILFLKGLILLKIIMAVGAIIISIHIAPLKTPKKFEY